MYKLLAYRYEQQVYFCTSYTSLEMFNRPTTVHDTRLVMNKRPTTVQTTGLEMNNRPTTVH